MSLEKCMEHIAEEGADLDHPTLTELSDLTPAELGAFARAWFGVSSQRKRSVVEALVGMAEDDAQLDFSAILKVCLRDPDPAVRQKAITGLWEFEDRSLIGPLVELLKSDRSVEVRASAAMALGKFASLSQDGKTLPRDGELVKGSLMDALQDENERTDVRRRALESVSAFNTPEIGDYIRWAYDSDDAEMKSSAIYAMGKTGEPEWLPLLFGELESSDPAIRYEAAHACGDMYEEEAVVHLIPLLQDDDLQVQLVTIDALGQIGGELAKRVLRRCLDMGDSILADAAQEALDMVQAMEDPLGFEPES